MGWSWLVAGFDRHRDGDTQPALISSGPVTHHLGLLGLLVPVERARVDGLAQGTAVAVLLNQEELPGGLKNGGRGRRGSAVAVRSREFDKRL
jgi:hypothetical protein